MHPNDSASNVAGEDGDARPESVDGSQASGDDEVPMLGLVQANAVAWETIRTGTQNISVAWTGFRRSTMKKPGKSGRFDAQCTCCERTMEGRTDVLQKHVSHYCSSITEEARTKYLTDVEKERREAADAGKQHKRKLGLASAGSSVSTPPAKRVGILDYMAPSLTPKAVAQVEEQLVRAFVTGNIPQRFASNPYFQSALRALNPSYTKPMSRDVFKRVLASLAVKTRITLEDFCKSGLDLTLQLDGWTDVSKRSLYAIVLASAKSHRLVDLLDMSADRHTSDNIRERVKEAAKDIQLNLGSNVIACVTDSPNVMKKFRRDLSEEFPNIIPIACVLHNLNLVAKDIASDPFAQEVIKGDLTLVNFVNASAKYHDASQVWAKEHDVNHSLQTHVATRWYSLGKVIRGVDSYAPWLATLPTLTGFPDLSVAVKDVLDNPLHFGQNKLLLLIFLPVINAIGHLEHSDADLSDVYIEYATIFQAWNKLVLTDIAARNCLAHAKASLNKRLRDLDHPVFNVALFLSPLHRRFAVSGVPKRLGNTKYGAMQMDILLMLKNWNYSQDFAEAVLAQLKAYFDGTAGVFSSLDQVRLPARSFWEQFAVGNEGIAQLREFALKVLSIKPHAAATESEFSSLGLIKTKSRNRMAVSTLKETGMIKSFLRAERVEAEAPKPKDWRSEIESASLGEVWEGVISVDAVDGAVSPVAMSAADIALANLWPQEEEEEVLEMDFGQVGSGQIKTLRPHIFNDLDDGEGLPQVWDLATFTTFSDPVPKPQVAPTNRAADGADWDVNAVLARAQRM